MFEPTVLFGIPGKVVVVAGAGYVGLCEEGSEGGGGGDAGGGIAGGAGVQCTTYSSPRGRGL